MPRSSIVKWTTFEEVPVGAVFSYSNENYTKTSDKVRDDPRKSPAVTNAIDSTGQAHHFYGFEDVRYVQAVQLSF